MRTSPRLKDFYDQIALPLILALGALSLGLTASLLFVIVR